MQREVWLEPRFIKPRFNDGDKAVRFVAQIDAAFELVSDHAFKKTRAESLARRRRDRGAVTFAPFDAESIVLLVACAAFNDAACDVEAPLIG